MYTPLTYMFLLHLYVYTPYIHVYRDENFDLYCRKMEDSSGVEWGGQLEIRAISDVLHIPVYIYDANSPVLKMGEEYLYTNNTGNNSNGNSDSSSSSDVANDTVKRVINLTFHRHYYSLGEHYNSAVAMPMIDDV